MMPLIQTLKVSGGGELSGSYGWGTIAGLEMESSL